MQGLLSFKLWWIFTMRLLNALFPTVVVLLVFSYNEIRKVGKTPCFRLLLVVFAVEFLSRLLIFFMGLPYQGRYLYAIAIFACIPAGAGLFELARLAAPYFKKIGLLRNVSAVSAILVVVFLFNAGKGLIHKEDKRYLYIIPAVVKENCPSGVRPLIVSEINDIRVGYYAKSNFLSLSYEGSSGRYVPVKKGWSVWRPELRPIEGIYLPVAKSEDMTRLIATLDHLEQGQKEVFLVVVMDDADFRAKFGAGASAELKLLKSFKNDEGKTISVYHKGDKPQ